MSNLKKKKKVAKLLKVADQKNTWFLNSKTK